MQGQAILRFARAKRNARRGEGIPFIKIANRVEVSVNLKWKRVSGAPPIFQQ